MLALLALACREVVEVANGPPDGRAIASAMRSSSLVELSGAAQPGLKVLKAAQRGVVVTPRRLPIDVIRPIITV